MAEKRSPRLMIQMPPRGGKSEIASVNFPPWHLGRYPDHGIIAASYASNLALKMSRKARGVVRDPRYPSVFTDLRLDPDSQSAEEWMTTKGGGYVAAGVGGPITGKGAHVLIIDDPVKNAEEADSETHRRSIKEWYTSTAYTRLAPGGGVLIIQTRWHDDDLSGWLEAQMEEGGDQFEIVRYPAVAEKDETFRRKGEALHPERYDLRSLERIRKAVGPRVWQALYQQNPVADDGEYFRRDMFQWYTGAPPQKLSVYAAFDLAIGKGDRNDWTVGAVVGVDEDDNMWVLDVRRGRWDAFQIVEQIIDVYRTWRPEVLGLEKGQISMAIGPYLEKRIQEERLWELYVKDLPTGRRDKEARARAIQGRMKQGKVRFPREAEWLDVVMHELLRFPNGVHDDIVDAFAWVGLMLQEVITPSQPRKRNMYKQEQGWRSRLAKIGRAARRKSFLTA